MIQFIRRLFSKKRKMEVLPSGDGVYIFFPHEEVEVTIDLKKNHFSLLHHQEGKKLTLSAHHAFTLGGVKKRRDWANSLREHNPKINWYALFGEMYQVSERFRRTNTND